MPTLGAILKTVSGLYLPPDGRVGFLAHELLDMLPTELLHEPFKFRRVERGIYVLVPQNASQPSFELRSRRNRARERLAAISA